MRLRVNKAKIILWMGLAFTVWMYRNSFKSRDVLPGSLGVPLGQLVAVGEPLPELLVRPDAVWMVETSGRSCMTPRELCALESAAAYNANKTIYLLTTNPRLSCEMNLGVIYPNIQVRYLHLENLFKNSVLDELWSSSKVHDSKWPITNLSDLLRYLILFKFGGTYLDTDVISIRSLPDFENFVGVELSELKTVGAGAIRFVKGHKVTKNILERLKTEFDQEGWGWNGPVILAQELNKLCRFQETDATDQFCDDVKLLKQSAFYAINWREINLYFEGSLENLENRLSDSIATHIWGTKTRGLELNPGSPLYLLAGKHCPISAKLLI